MRGKKINLFLIAIFSTILFSNCSKDADSSFVKKAYDNSGAPRAGYELISVDTSSERISSSDIISHIKPIFFTETPDEINPSPETITNNSTASASNKTQSVVPGLRPLKDYKTTYNPVRLPMPKATERVESSEFTSTYMNEDGEIVENHSFYVEDWGPYSTIVSENRYPTFYVIFSQPVKALTSLEEPSDKSDVMTITPPLKGIFRWYGSQHLSFECEEPADPSVEYTITINPKLKSNSGDLIQGKTTFTTEAAPLEIYDIWPGYISANNYNYSSSTGALPPYENIFLLRTNYMISTEKIKNELEVRVNSRKIRYTVKQDYDSSNFAWYSTPLFDKDKKLTNTFVITIRDEVPHNANVEVSLKNGGYYNKKTYSTLKPFNITYFQQTARTSDKGFYLYFSFSHNVDKESLLKYLSTDVPGYKINEKNVSVSGSTVYLYNLNLDMDREYHVYFNNKILDTYKQSLSLYENVQEYSFKIPTISGYVNYLDYGAKMMEAQYPHKLLYEYMNADGYYKLSKTENPLYTSYNYKEDDISYFLYSDKKITKTYIESPKRNTRYFEEIDLNPYLKNGYGFVRFYANTNYDYYSYYYNDSRRNNSTNHLTVQVTDIGVTARNAINKSVYLVSSLSTGAPLANAKVTAYLRNTSDPDPVSNVLGTGTTDQNGLCVINYSNSSVEKYIDLKTSDSSYNYQFTVLVEKGDDKVMFSPSSHNSWRYDVYTSSIQNSAFTTQKTFMFVDRGLYRPGEIVTFKGIDRDLALGTLSTYNGSYSIRCKGAWWNSSDIISPITGRTTENGSFDGSFKIPDSIEPGTYEIYYRRDYSNDRYDNYYVTFKVANFERVKSQATFSSPEDTLFAGQTISTALNASYLAGGALSGANYNIAWYAQQSSFHPKTIESKGFTFGSNRWYSDSEYWSGSEGQLDTAGSAILTCSTRSNQNGDPYIYRADANVVDVSNQMIYSSTSFTVHPSLFYIGVKRSGNKGGYPKINNKLDFDLLLVDTNGNKLSEQNIKENVNSLKYQLSRETWVVVHEQSVDDTVYTRYEEVDEVVDSGSIKPNQNKFSYTPKVSGWYTLRVEGQDSTGKNAITSYSFYVTGGSSYWYDRYNSQSLNLTPDQNEYNPGDTAQILLESSLPKGDYLITVEREGIYTEEVRHFDSPSNVIELKIASNYVPVVYVSVSSYSVRDGKPTHQYGETDLDKPKGYYGVTPIFVNPYVRAFSVKVETDKNIYKPGDTAKVTLTATKGGKPLEGAELTAMAVDRGVLDLINYHVPNPIDYFYNSGSYPLCVSGGDSRTYLMDPVTYSIKNLQGGDSDDKKENERKDFRPTAFFEPTLITGKDGKVSCTFKLPDSLTTYRITAFGVKDDLFALQEKEIQAQNPVNVQQVQPRKLRERDTAECGVVISNLQDTALDVTVSLEARTPTGDTEQDKLEGRKTYPGKAFIDGPSKHTVYIAPGDSTVVYFDVAAQSEGTVELVYTIKSKVYNEKLISPIKIEKTYVYDTVVTIGQTTDSEKTKQVEELALPSFAKDGRGDLSFTLDATRLGVLGSSVNYLFEYPYGCMEQQSARVLPLVLFDEYIDVFGLNSKVSNIKACVTSFTKDWKKVQHENGGFPYWPSNTRDENFYVSLRLAHIYGVAKERGYTDKELGYDINKLIKYLKNNIGKEQSNYIKAYYCYVLKLLGDNSCETLLSQLNKKRRELTISEEALIGLAYSFSDSKSINKITKEISDDLRKYLQPVERSVTVLSKDKTRSWYWYDDSTSELALILKLFVKNNPNDKMVDRLLFTLLQQQQKGYWHSTSTTTTVLDSIYTYIKARNLDNTNYTATVSLNGKKIASESFKGVTAKPKTLSLPFEDEIIKSLPKDKIIPVTFEKDGPGYLFYTMQMKYALPDEMQNYRDEGINVEYTITDYYTGDVINVDSANNPSLVLESGKLYRATIRIETKRDRSYVALRCPVPSGAEIIDSQFISINPAVRNNGEDYYGEDYYNSYNYYNYYYWNYNNKDIMDNEVQYFWDTLDSGFRTVSFTFRAVRRGVYPTPPVQAECMYEEEIFGRSDGYLMQIK